MYPQVFEIRIDDESKKFYAGQVIEGRVILVLQKEKAVRGISIRLVGKGNVYWDTGVKHNVFSDSEVFVNHSCQLLVPEDGRQTVLRPGTYEYLFSLQIPQHAPGSIEGQHGFIRYYLESAIQRPWKDDQIQEKVIHVTSISDLSSFPESQEPTSIQKEKRVGINICQAGPIQINWMLGKTGFVPGEYLQFGIEIRNTSSTRINRVQVSLKRQFNYHAKGETKTTHDKFLQLNGPSAEIGGYLLWQSNFEIPILPPSELPGCNIISIQYYVEAKLALEKWADVKCHMPIRIGTMMYNVKNRKFSEALSCHETPKKSKSRAGSITMSRKSSVVKSPITGEEFTYDPEEEEWDEQRKEKGNEFIMSAPPVISMPTNIPVPTPLQNGIPFTALPPLDLVFFQHKPERNPYFKCYEDCDREGVNPYRFNTAVASNNYPQEDKKQPPRPHSNPGHYWGKTGFWDEDE